MFVIISKVFKFHNVFENQSKNVLNLINLKLYCTAQQQDSGIHSEHNDKEKLLRISVIGAPNAGKSTFINNLINHRVCPTSSKVHTTRRSNKAIYTEKNTQIVLYDTPGLVTKSEIKKYNLGTQFSSSYRDSIQHSDMIAVVHDVSNSWARNQLHSTVLETLNCYSNLPSFLVLNKIDLLKSKRTLLDVVKILSNNTISKTKTRNLKQKHKENIKDNETFLNKEVGWSNFNNIFMVSSITGNGLNEIMRMLLNEAKLNKWHHPAEIYTDETPENIIVESVRARLLDYLPQEIPYKLQVLLEYFNEENNTIFASVQILCPNLRLERLLCGESNGKLRQITERITSDLVETFSKPVSLTVTTYVNKSARAASN